MRVIRCRIDMEMVEGRDFNVKMPNPDLSDELAVTYATNQFINEIKAMLDRGDEDIREYVQIRFVEDPS